MTNTIEIDGIIGWDVYPSEISAQLKSFKGKPVDILFSSDGGYISDGLAIFNHIHDYEGHTTAIIIGMAASMASYIPLAADKVIAKSNAVMMIHDPLMGTYGNQSEHEKSAKILGGFANMLSNIYAQKTGKSLAEIRGIMREESFFFGSEILDAGLVDEIDEIEVSDKKKDDVIIDAMLRFEMASKRIETKPEDFTKIAAYLPKADNTQTSISTPGRPAFSNIQTEEKRMDKNQFKAEHPDVYQEAVDDGKKLGAEASKETAKAEGQAAGILLERKRISEIEALAMPSEFTAKAKTEDWSAEHAASEYLKAEAVKKSAIASNMETDANEPLASDAPADVKAPESAKAENPIEEYNAAVAKAQDGGKVSLGQAMKAVKLANPELHQKNLDATNKGDK